MRTCHGNGEDHCCYVRGEVCEFLEENTIEGRRWVCGLLRELGSWDKVHEDPRYIDRVQPAWDGFDCGTWPWVLPDERLIGASASALCCFGEV